MSLFSNIVVGLSTGIVSSLLVACILQRRLNKKDFQRRFHEDQQNLCRYIKQLLNEVMLYEKSKDETDLLRLLENEPLRYSFSNIQREDHDFLLKFQQLQKEINNFCVEHHACYDFNIEEVQQLCNWQTKLHSYSLRCLKIAQPKKWRDHRDHKVKRKK